MASHTLSRRAFLPLSAMLPWSLRAYASTSIPVGLELYSVRNALKDDLTGTLGIYSEGGIEPSLLQRREPNPTNVHGSPFGGIVRKPLAKLGAGGDLLQSQIDASLLLR